MVDRVVCARQPEPFMAVRQGYDDFTQTPDEEVVRIMAAARRSPPDPPPTPSAPTPPGDR
jgi:putative phosphoribosyl transferase